MIARLIKLFRCWWPFIQETWQDRDEQRGRTAPLEVSGGGGAMTAAAEPEASLQIKVTRADGTIEHHDASAQITTSEGGQ